eukprot:m.17661 g.17661  ORF g.17661 m.17661 type:complete len:470 (+) comp11599_c1_seq1:238-1647(+)
MSSSVAFTCMACRVGFHEPEAQRNHYKTDWHRYNLKRKMAELTPITATDFRLKVTQQQLQKKAEAEQAAVESKCEVCSKRFGSLGAYQTHMASKKHKEKAKTPSATREPSTTNAVSKATLDETGADTESTMQAGTKTEKKTATINRLNALNAEVDENDQEALDKMYEDYVPDADMVIDLEDCIFCTHKSENLEENLKHMTYQHGFFVPDIEYCVDLSGLIRYLQDKVTRYHLCLTCNSKGRAFYSTEAARGHMFSKGHCFVEYEEEGQIELEDFYDFKPSWEAYFNRNPGAREEMEREKEAAANGTTTNNNAEGDDEDWEDVDDDDTNMADDDDDDDEEMDSKPVANQIMLMSESDRHLAILKKYRGHVSVKGLEMVLPSGKSLGHRSMRRYYKQSFAVPDERDSVVIQKLVSEYNAIGLPGFGSGAPTKEARRDRSHHHRIQMRASMRQGMNNNKGDYNKHIREQNTQ